LGLGRPVQRRWTLNDRRTKSDGRFRNAFQGDARTGTGDDYAARFNDYGDLMDMKLSVPLYLGAMFLGRGGDRHYMSHVVLGWSLAYLATGTVATSGEAEASIRLAPIIMDDGVAIGAEMAF